jgi:hypothetical protein
MKCYTQGHDQSNTKETLDRQVTLTDVSRKYPSFWSGPRLLTEEEEVRCSLLSERKRQYIGQVTPNCKRMKLLRAIKDKIKVNNNCEVGHTPFLSFLWPWHLDGLRAGQPGFDSRHGQMCLFSTMSRLDLGPTKPLIQWVQGELSPGVKRSGREAERQPYLLEEQGVRSGLA